MPALPAIIAKVMIMVENVLDYFVTVQMWEGAGNCGADSQHV